MKILAIESSCDETAAAVLEDKAGLPAIISNVVSSQIDIHKEYGGVVPEVAARAHIENIIPVIQTALDEAKTDLKGITHLAVTYGPGLIGSLVVGVETAKALAAATGIPLIPVNHLEGHLYANFLTGAEKQHANINKTPEFPIIALVVSGGHTMLVLMNDHLSYQVIGKTRDDAAGEAFDKAAKIMGLGYPGGPILSKLAENGNENSYDFPLIDLTPAPKRNAEGFLEQPEPSLDFSFSGLKTSLLTKVKQSTINQKQLTDAEIADLSAAFETAIAKNLASNTIRAVQRYKPKTFILSGGVAANKKLRETLKRELKKISPELLFLVPEGQFCTDNAAMIGAAAYFHIKKSKPSSLDFAPEPNLELK